MLTLPTVWYRRLFCFGQWAIYLLIAWVVFVCGVLLIVRFYFLPQIDDFRGVLTDRLQSELKQTVVIERLSAEWDGWNPRIEILGLKIVDSDNQAVLTLPKIDAWISWRALLTLDLRLRQLVFSSPRLKISRNQDGKIYVAGVLIQGVDKSPADTKLLEWILQQHFVEMQNAEISWHDAQKGAPVLNLRDLNFRLRNVWGNHQFGLSFLPPVGIAGRVDLRGDVAIGRLYAWETWRGRVYSELNTVDLSQWKQWIPLPENVSGKGILRGWFDFAKARVTQATVDLALSDLAGRFQPDLSAIELPGLSGRVTWRSRNTAAGLLMELAVKNLIWDLPNGQRTIPMNFQLTQSWMDEAVSMVDHSLVQTVVAKLKTQKTKEEPVLHEFGQGRLAADQLLIDPLLQVAQYFSLPSEWHDNLLRYRPSGLLKGVDLAWKLTQQTQELDPRAPNKNSNEKEPANDSWVLRLLGLGVLPKVALQWHEMRADLENIQWLANEGVPQLPGVRGLSGKLDADRDGGKFRLNSTGLQVSLPRLFEEALRFDTFTGLLVWKRVPATRLSDRASNYTFNFSNLMFANADLNGIASGQYKTEFDGPGWIDMTAKLMKTRAQAIGNYLPLVLSAETRNWLKGSLSLGLAPEAKLTLVGNLANFPFEGRADGKFEVAATVKDVSLHYATGWPEITGIQGKLLFRGDRMEITADDGSIGGVRLGQTKATIASLSSHKPRLNINGSANGNLDNFLAFVVQSPVANWINHFTDRMQGSGPVKLGLQFDLPLADLSEPAKVQGELNLLNNQVKLYPSWPELTVQGKLSFTEQRIDAEALTGKFDGGIATASLHSADGKVELLAHGDVDLAAFDLPKIHPLLSQVQGNTDWRLSARIYPDNLDWVLESNLQGIEIGLPSPLSKRSTQIWPLRLERVDLSKAKKEGVEQIKGQLSTLTEPIASFLVERSGIAKDSSEQTMSGWLHFGNKTSTSAGLRPGFWVTGNLREFSFDQWLNMDQVLSSGALSDKERVSANKDTASWLHGVNLNFGVLDVGGKRLRDLQLNATHQKDSWNLDLVSPIVQGTAHYSPVGKGKIRARLKRLSLPDDAPVELKAIENEESSNNDEPGQELPEIDLIADQFFLKERNLGKLALLAHPNLRAQEWRLDQLKLESPDGTIELNGVQKGLGERARTQVKTVLNIANIGLFLQRFDLPGGVSGGKGKITGELLWQGPIQDINYPTMSGEFQLEAQNGQFIKVDPGLGKLLGVLSLQALPKRITLDFKDIFSEGFAFDQIAGDVTVQRGVMHTENLKINGSAAKIQILGTVDLDQETQNLRVKVLPSISNLFVVAPVVAISPIIGAAILAGSKLLNDPFDQAFARDYQVTGTWIDPKVQPLTTIPTKTLP